jgi:peptide/nickel transport system substrate-binding protein
MKFTQWARGAAVTAAAALVLSACGGSSTPASGDGADAGSGGEPTTLRLSLQSPPSNFQIGNWSGGDATLFLSAYDTLVHRALDGSVEPAIAQSWEYNEDRTQLTLSIREGMTFTDGTPVDAAAVAASLEAARQGTSTAQNFAAIASVEATDQFTVVVTLSRPDAALVESLAGTGGAIGAPEVLAAEDSKLWPVGSGPYVLSEEESTVGSKYVLEKNDEHWNADAYPYDTVEVSIMPDPTAVSNAILAGQLDYAGLQSADAQAQFPENQFTTGTNNPTAVGALFLVDRAGSIVPALKDARVRRAINMAFDREGIAKNLNPGTNHPTNQMFHPEDEAFSEELLQETPYDLEEAKQLMADAGYADGFSVTMPSTVVSTAYESVITQSLSDIGIDVTWESVPFQDFYSKVFGGNYGMFFMFNGFGGSAALDYNAFQSGIFNPFHSTTPELEALVAAANAAPEEKQGEAFGALNEYLVDEGWFAPITSVTGFYVVPNTVKYTPPVVFGQSVLPFAPAESN